MVSFTAKAQSDFVVWFRPRNKCPAASLRRSRPLPTNIGSAFSDSLAINAPAGAEEHGSLSEEDVDVEAAPWGTQLASAPGFAPAVNVSVSPADKSTPASVQGREAEMVKEYWAGLAGEVWPKTIRLVHNRTLLHNPTKTAAERRWVFKAPLQEELRKMPHIIAKKAICPKKCRAYLACD
jgi:hypothetical protein